MMITSCHHSPQPRAFSFQDPIIGGSLLLTYTTGYVAPLLIAASFAGALQVSALLYYFS
jgi:hypothetical protein